jgi:ferredoxin
MGLTRIRQRTRTRRIENGGPEMHVWAEEAKCVGAGQCVMAAPKVFDQRDDDGIVVVLNRDPTSTDESAVRTAAALCPAAAIHYDVD